jgi:hypothetical protein
VDVSRRTLIVGGTSALVGAGVGAGVTGFMTADRTGPALWQRGDRSGAPLVGGVHVQFGADAAAEVVVSWHTAGAVNNPRVMMGTPDGGFGTTASAETVTYRDAASGTEIRVHHARLTGLAPDTDYVYAAVHDGASAEVGTVRTAPRGRAPLRFTSFGDQSTPTLDAKVASAFGSDNLGSPSAGDITTAVERAAPLFNLVNGDLCYANLSADRVRTWSDWFENNSRSARYRPWMPAAGNHENELGNGPIGYGAYQAYFALPDGATRIVVRVHSGLGAGDQPGQRRCVLSGRRQLLRTRLLRWRAKALARKGTRPNAQRPRNRLDRGVHAPDRGVDG